MIAANRSIALIENRQTAIPVNELPEEEASAIREKWKHVVRIEREFGGKEWNLTPRSYVGQIPISERIQLVIQPKVALSNVFYMLDVAYRAKFQLFDNVTACESLEDSYDRLARVFAKRVIDRARKGLYRSYVSDEDRLSFVRGRVDIRQSLKPQTDVRLHCHFEEHTADLVENQILLWTLSTILRGRLVQPDTTSWVKAAHRVIRGGVSLVPYTSSDCVGRVYNRLNEDYRTLHCLCRFFLEQMSPILERGRSDMLPFLIEMSSLFELYVAESLQSLLPSGVRISAQERVDAFEDRARCSIDLVLYDAIGNRPIAVLDTKYKTAHKAKESDVYQVVAYANAKGCSKAVLVYPEREGFWRIATFGGVYVYGLGWSIDGDMRMSSQRAKEAIATLNRTDAAIGMSGVG